MNDPAPTTGPGDRTQFQVDRLAFFSDAVFAIAITLLALNIHPSALTGPVSEGVLAHAVAGMVPRIVGFTLSFLVVGNYWRSHHRLFRWVRNCTPRLVTINVILLLFVSFMPAPTAFYSDFPAYRSALFFYMASLSLVGLANFTLWAYLGRHPELLDPATPPLDLRIGAERSLVIPATCLVAALLSYVNLWLSGLAMTAIPLWTRIYTRLVSRTGPARQPGRPAPPPAT